MSYFVYFVISLIHYQYHKTGANDVNLYAFKTHVIKSGLLEQYQYGGKGNIIIFPFHFALSSKGIWKRGALLGDEK